MAYPLKTISAFQHHVIEKITHAFPELKTMGAKVRLNRQINTPAAFIELNDFTHPENLSLDDLSLECRFSVRLVCSSEENTLALEDLAVKLSHFIKGNRWNADCSPAKILGASSDHFSDMEEAYQTFEIRFEQTITFTDDSMPLCKSA